MGEPLLHDQIPVIAGPSSYLLTRRRGFQLPAKNNCAVPHKYGRHDRSVYTRECFVLVVTMQNKPALRCAMGRSQEKHNERPGFQLLDKVMQIPQGSGCTNRVGSREHKAR